jgi:hypothetical protein
MLINLLGFEFGPETELVKVSLLFSSVTLAPEDLFVCLFLGSLSLFFVGSILLHHQNPH